jgi:transcriptional regulator with XRE-family HTH domain
MNNVRFLKDQRGMTQDEFAEYCDVPRVSIARYETGAEISRKNAKKIAAACNVSVDFVLGIPGAEQYQIQSREDVAALMADLTPAEQAQVRQYAVFLKSTRKSD